MKNSKPLTSGHKVVRTRFRFQLSQREMADLLGVSQPYVSMIETGKLPLTRELQERLEMVVTNLHQEMEEVYD